MAGITGWIGDIAAFVYPESDNFLNLNNVIGGATDALGLTDREAAQRGLDEMTEKADSAQDTLNTRMNPVFDMYQNAMQGREMGDVLNTYNQQMMGTENAAGANNVQNFLNPMYNRAMQSAANQAMAGAGSSLQSSANANAVANAVANQSTNMWNTAFNQAMQDAQNKQGIYNNTMQANLMPSLNWAQLTSDIAGTEYTKNMDLAQAAGQVAGQNQAWLANLF